MGVYRDSIPWPFWLERSGSYVMAPKKSSVSSETDFELGGLFQALDADRNGLLSPEELADAEHALASVFGYVCLF